MTRLKNENQICSELNRTSITTAQMLKDKMKWEYVEDYYVDLIEYENGGRKQVKLFETINMGNRIDYKTIQFLPTIINVLNYLDSKYGIRIVPTIKPAGDWGVEIYIKNDENPVGIPFKRISPFTRHFNTMNEAFDGGIQFVMNDWTVFSNGKLSEIKKQFGNKLDTINGNFYN